MDANNIVLNYHSNNYLFICYIYCRISIYLSNNIGGVLPYVSSSRLPTWLSSCRFQSFQKLCGSALLTNWELRSSIGLDLKAIGGVHRVLGHNWAYGPNGMAIWTEKPNYSKSGISRLVPFKIYKFSDLWGGWAHKVNGSIFFISSQGGPKPSKHR